ncbi:MULTISPECIES: CopG family ribbon-helix-helix protein [Phyllobacteriaceae]|jgi:predicted transcriptional regulator|uniref:CopG family transcriptional regulator n=1 Tax=Ollibium composti TaxID=2675109 RepID=A0ABY2Q7J3_9HYPH|nr:MULTISPECIES: CopG family ribbon-helix-helix protein [Mesorhizobium]QDC01238.1 CopG family transcriptional regulator [Mesorhizobium sp. 8]THF57470.1 CopG family transcriptional regulator [Mesorhizobium composti]
MSTQSETVTVRLSPETKSRLETLAEHTRRTKSFLAGEAIADYVERELAIVEGIKRGLADIEAGRVTPHKEAMRRIRATIDRAQKS